MSDAVAGGRTFATLAVAMGALLHSGFAIATEGQECPDQMLAAVAAWAGIKGDPVPVQRDESNGIVVASACKAMPDMSGTTIVVAAFDTRRKEPPDQDDTKVQVVALLDQRTNRVVAGSRSTVEEDAATHVGEASYGIDTARYRLAPNVRAFGVVFDSDAPGASCPDADAGSELTLYVREGARLRPVMGTNLHGWVGACGASSGPARNEEAQMSIALAKTRTNGFADLLITAHITQTIRDANNDYRDGAARTASMVLHYDGNSYGTDMFREFWYSASVKKAWGIP